MLDDIIDFFRDATPFLIILAFFIFIVISGCCIWNMIGCNNYAKISGTETRWTITTGCLAYINGVWVSPCQINSNNINIKE